MDNIKLLTWLVAMQLIMTSLFILTPLLLVALAMAAPLAPSIPLVTKCTRMAIDNNTYATWACNKADKDNIAIVGHRPYFTLTYEYEDAMRLRLFLDRCRDGDACPDYEVIKDADQPDCYHQAADAHLRNLVKLCFDQYWFFKSFEAGPLKLNNRKALVQLHRALIGYTQSVFFYRLFLENGLLAGEYPGTPVKEHPPLDNQHPIFNS